MYRIISHSYPNNEIRTVFSAVSNSKPFQYDDPLESPDIALSDRLIPTTSDNYSSSVACDLVSTEKNLLPPLSLIRNSKSQRYTTGYGSLPEKPTKFGLNAKRTVIRSGGALEKSSKPEECLFLTGTLPGSTEDSFKAIASYSAYLVNGLKAWISNYIPNKLDFYVWEYQKRGALHLHYCIHAPDITAREFILKNFKAWWIGILHKIGEKSNCDLFKKNAKYSHRSNENKVRAVAEICRKSPARYLAKYLTKSVHPKRGNARFFTPSRWFGVSRPLNALLKSLTKVTEIIVSDYFSVISQLQEVKYVCDSSDSVTYKFRHKYGLGDTTVCYPNSPEENIALWNSLEALSTMRKIDLNLKSVQPMAVWEVQKTRLMNWSVKHLNRLSNQFQGLKECLLQFSNMMRQTTPSESRAALSWMLQMNAHILGLQLSLKYTPQLKGNDARMFEHSIDTLNLCMNELALSLSNE